MSDELKKEMLGVGLLGLFLFILMCLISYHPFDPSLNTISSAPVKNLCGKAGSYASDALIQLFGLMSYLLVAFLLLFGVVYVRRKSVPHPLLLAAGLALFFISSSMLLQVLFGKVQIRSVTIPFSGLLGLLLEKTLLNVFSRFGSVLISVIIFVISLFLMLQVPLVSVVEKRVARRRSVERTKEIKVIQEEKKPQPPKEEKKPVQETFEFVKDISPYKLPSTSLLDEIEKREV
jgi:S-DNA-T family DNA segregation ATPase FtsK/SpoIIIE